MTPAAVVHPCPQTTQGGKGAKPNQPHTVRSLSGLEFGGTSTLHLWQEQLRIFFGRQSPVVNHTHIVIIMFGMVYRSC